MLYNLVVDRVHPITYLLQLIRSSEYEGFVEIGNKGHQTLDLNLVQAQVNRVWLF